MEATTTAPKKRISKTMRWARAHKFMIYEVTDPELRSQLCYYRNKEKQQQEDINQKLDEREVLPKGRKNV